MPRRRTQSDRGFVLVAVIWFVALIALAAASFAGHIRQHIRAAAQFRDAAVAEALAEGAAVLVSLRHAHIEPGRSKSFRLNGSELGSCTLANGAVLAVRVQDAGGLVDLNAAPRELLTRLFTWAGTDDPVALAQAVLDFRDADAISADGRPERAAYPPDAFPNAPKNAAFEHIFELDQVPGAGPFIEILLPLVTVESGQSGVDPIAAPASLVEALSRPETAMIEPRFSVTSARRYLLIDVLWQETASWRIGVATPAPGVPPTIRQKERLPPLEIAGDAWRAAAPELCAMAP